MSSPTHRAYQAHRNRLVTTARRGRLLVFLIPLLLFGLAPLYSAREVFGTPEDIVATVRFLQWGVISAGAFVGLIAVHLLREARLVDVAITLAGFLVMAGMLGFRWIAIDPGYAFPALLPSIYVAGLLFVARLPLWAGLSLAITALVASLVIEWVKAGGSPETAFNSLSIISSGVVASYGAWLLNNSGVRATLIEHELARQARTDPLTGLGNRRYFTEMAQRELSRLQRAPADLSLLLVDLDHFKKINDQFGHASGDAVLRAFATLVAKQIREIDIAGRMGGEEFAVLMPDADLSRAQIAAERLRSTIETHPVMAESGEPIRWTASIGVAQWQASDSVEALVSRADKALYAAKRAGRNRVA